MSSAPYVSRIDPELWSFVDDIARHIPRDLDVWRCEDEVALIDAPGRRGSMEALRAIQRALRRYYVHLVIAALKIALPPRATLCQDRCASEPIDWFALGRVPWSVDDRTRETRDN